MTETTIKYKHIKAFARHMDVTRGRAYQALEAEDPVYWEAYAEFREKLEEEKLSRVNDAKQRVAQLQNV